MDTIVLEAGTAELLPLQGRVGVSRVDMGTLGVVVMALFGREHVLLEGAGRGCPLIDWSPERVVVVAFGLHGMQK